MRESNALCASQTRYARVKRVMRESNALCVRVTRLRVENIDHTHAGQFPTPEFLKLIKIIPYPNINR